MKRIVGICWEVMVNEGADTRSKSEQDKAGEEESTSQMLSRKQIYPKSKWEPLTGFKEGSDRARFEV